MPWTPEELEAMRQADAEIEEDFEYASAEEKALSGEIDALALEEAQDHNRNRKLARRRELYAASKAEHGEAVLKTRRAAYYQANREKILAQQKRYYAENRAEILDYHAAYQKANRQRIAAYKAEYQQAHRDELRAKSAKYGRENREKISAYQKDYYQRNKEVVKAKRKAYYEAHREEINAKRSAKRQVTQKKEGERNEEIPADALLRA